MKLDSGVDCLNSRLYLGLDCLDSRLACLSSGVGLGLDCLNLGLACLNLSQDLPVSTRDLPPDLPVWTRGQRLPERWRGPTSDLFCPKTGGSFSLTSWGVLGDVCVSSWGHHSASRSPLNEEARLRLPSFSFLEQALDAIHSFTGTSSFNVCEKQKPKMKQQNLETWENKSSRSRNVVPGWSEGGFIDNYSRWSRPINDVINHNLICGSESRRVLELRLYPWR